jgi:hypothetical protein
MIKTTLEDGRGSGTTWRIDGEGTGHVIVHPHPPSNETLTLLPVRERMTLNGDGTTFDMRVDGSVNEQVFSVHPKNLAALTNGMTLCWVTDEFGTVVIADGLVSNWEFVRLSGGNPAYGDSTSSFRASNVSGTSEGYLIQIDFDEIFGIKWGFRLRHGTNDRLELVIKDDVTGVDQFDAICYGSEF